MAAVRQGVWTQERIVLGLAVLLFAVSAVTLRGFLDPPNLISIIRSVSPSTRKPLS